MDAFSQKYHFIMSDKEGDSFDDIQNPIEFTILQSETKSFQVPADQDVFFTNAELLNIQPDSTNKVVILSIDYEVIYFHSESNSDNEDQINADANINSNKDNERAENIDGENKATFSHQSPTDARIPKKALDHIIIPIPISPSLSSVSDSNSMGNSSSIQISNSNQNSITSSSQTNSAENSLPSNLLNQNFNYNSSISSNSMPIQIQFCPDMNPVFHVNGPADVKLTGFTAPTNYNFIDEEEESENDDIEENIQDGNLNDQSDDDKIDRNTSFNEKDKLDNMES